MPSAAYGSIVSLLPAPEFPLGTVLGIMIPLGAIVTYGLLGRKFSDNRNLKLLDRDFH
jgi:hypothetical protein